MSSEIQNKKKLNEKLRDSYRLVIIDNENLKEVGNYIFSMRRLYAYMLATFLIFSILLVSFIAVTPLKTLMPGYGDIEENSKFIELRNKIDLLENELELQATYTQGLQNMLSGLPNDTNSSKSDIQVPKSTTNNPILSDANLQESKITQPLNSIYFVPPVIGSISTQFDPSIGHLGTDITAPSDTAIKSISAGSVIGSDFTLDTGNTITIQHPNNIISIYKHNSALLKKIGEQVNAGEAIAIIGNTGEMTTGPHLHFELWYKGTPVNPENFINFN